MASSSRNTRIRILKRAAWGLFFLVCAFYAAYALYMGVVEILFQLGLVTEAAPRAVPIVFIIHALAGSIVLVCGPLQFNRRLLAKNRQIHRMLGGAYVGAVWIASISGLWNAIFFDVTLPARISFGMLSILWFGTTTIALQHIVKRDIAAHREWMIRSFSLSLFFVSFSFWVPGLTSTSLPEAVSYPLAVSLSWSLNLMVAQLWIWRTRPHARQVPTSMNHDDALQGVG